MRATPKRLTTTNSGPSGTVYGEPHPIRTLEVANAAVNACERYARTSDGMAPRKTPLEPERIEVLKAEGERGRRYRAELIRAGGRADRLDVTVTDPSRPGKDHGARERVLRTTGDGVVRSLEAANEVVNRYELAAAGQVWPGMGGRKLAWAGRDPAVRAPRRPDRPPESKPARRNRRR